MLRIGPVQLATNLFLAPVAGYFDLANRLVIKSVKGVPCEAGDLGGPLDAGDGTYGAVGLTCTELLCPQSILKESDKALWMSATHPDETPVSMQLYGAEPHILAEAARWAESHGAATIDINMGCPVDKVTKKNGGSKLLCDPMAAVEVARCVVNAVKVPVSCKIRLGWDDSQLIVDTLPPALCDAGVQLITVHGRTTEMRFMPSVRLDGIRRAVASVKKHHPHIPVIGNGDVVDGESAVKLREISGCDGVMLGRGALGNPWIYREVEAALNGQALPPAPSVTERQRVLLRHIELQEQHEFRPLGHLRRVICWYFKDCPGVAAFRDRIHHAQSLDEMRALILAFTSDAVSGVPLPSAS